MTQHLLTVATRAGNLAATLQDSIDQIANRQRIAKLIEGYEPVPPEWLALTDAQIEAALGVQDAVRRLMNAPPEPVTVPPEWPERARVLPFRRVK